jgi:hypothetical protein
MAVYLHKLKCNHFKPGSLISSDECIYPSNPHHNPEKEYFHLTEMFLAYLQLLPHPPLPKATSVLLSDGLTSCWIQNFI